MFIRGESPERNPLCPEALLRDWKSVFIGSLSYRTIELQAVAICCALPVNACLWPTNDELTDAIVGSGAWRMLRVQGAVRLHGRNPLFVPCSAFVMRGAALALLDASAIGLMPGSIAARGCATAGSRCDRERSSLQV